MHFQCFDYDSYNEVSDGDSRYRTVSNGVVIIFHCV